MRGLRQGFSAPAIWRKHSDDAATRFYAMLILALEGALARCSVALLRDDALLSAALHEAPRGHPSALPPMAEQVLAEAGAAPASLDAIAVGVGPGGFTGLRTAIALAEGLAQALGKPVMGVTTGEALASAVPPSARAGQALWSVLDKRQGRVVLEIFPPGAAWPEAPMILQLADLPDPAGPVLLVGDAAAPVATALTARGFAASAMLPEFPLAEAVGRVAGRILAGKLPQRSAAPLYAEAPATTRPG
ncbi:MAG: tRNA (adenosine(37)-N6)-threonylcarbamoyltransferase complex dimerization subunit type 1 TsaB [Alphaproteobacteria bacterium]|nr:tRNA (adenosine(37)-N6)-threonylcarbamoyltransferase complex dimerization subunit type 1 TsaB [Alphaproteobacteria bacterium]